MNIQVTNARPQIGSDSRMPDFGPLDAVKINSTPLSSTTVHYARLAKTLSKNVPLRWPLFGLTRKQRTNARTARTDRLKGDSSQGDSGSGINRRRYWYLQQRRLGAK